MNSYLIDIGTLKTRGYVNGNVENGLLNTVLERVQDTMLTPILGTSLFKRLVKGVRDADLSVDERELLNEYVTPFLSAAVDYKSVYFILTEIRAKTVGKSGDQYINPLSNADAVGLKDELWKDVELYRTRLIGYLQDNCEKYPSYKRECSNESVGPDRGAARTNIRFV